MLNQTPDLPLVNSETRCRPLVLVVDDNHDNLAFACSSLELFNLRHIVASSSQIALDLAMDRLPDIILLDIVMPKIDGITLAAFFKRNPLTDHIPIIAVTGLALPEQKKQILNSGCDDYLCKPYLIEDLKDKIASFLNLKAIK